MGEGRGGVGGNTRWMGLRGETGARGSAESNTAQYEE